MSQLSEQQLKYLPQLVNDYGGAAYLCNNRMHGIFQALSAGVRYVYNACVEGEIAEFGTANGVSAYFIAHAMRIYAAEQADFQKVHQLEPRTLLLFDSFAGLPTPDDPVDLGSRYVQDGRWKGGSFQGLNPKELFELCSSQVPKEHLIVAPGWFEETLPLLPEDTRFAMVHLDCDLYSSTYEVLDYMFEHDHFSDGAVVFFDDWNCNFASPLHGQRKAWRDIVAKYGFDYSDGGEYGVLSHKFYLHLGS